MSAPGELTENDCRELLRIARISLEEWLHAGRAPTGSPHRPSLLERRSVFVTIEVAGKLRGCIGRIDPETPLYRTVTDLTVSAATADARFPPVRVDETPQARIEISLLSVPERIAAPAEIAIGTHGLLITRGARRGLLLPRVPVEHAWDVETFLGQTCHKAGLADDAWRQPETAIERFTAQVFSEPTS